MNNKKKNFVSEFCKINKHPICLLSKCETVDFGCLNDIFLLLPKAIENLIEVKKDCFAEKFCIYSNL